MTDLTREQRQTVKDLDHSEGWKQILGRLELEAQGIQIEINTPDVEHEKYPGYRMYRIGVLHGLGMILSVKEFLEKGPDDGQSEE